MTRTHRSNVAICDGIARQEFRYDFREPCPHPGQRLPVSRTAAGSRRKKAGEGHSKKSRNEGRTHDIIDNKGPISGTHDVHEK
jgi:hypothetical protein